MIKLAGVELYAEDGKKRIGQAVVRIWTAEKWELGGSSIAYDTGCTYLDSVVRIHNTYKCNA